MTDEQAKPGKQGNPEEPRNPPGKKHYLMGNDEELFTEEKQRQIKVATGVWDFRTFFQRPSDTPTPEELVRAGAAERNPFTDAYLQFQQALRKETPLQQPPVAVKAATAVQEPLTPREKEGYFQIAGKEANLNSEPFDYDGKPLSPAAIARLGLQRYKSTLEDFLTGELGKKIAGEWEYFGQATVVVNPTLQEMVSIPSLLVGEYSDDPLGDMVGLIIPLETPVGPWGGKQQRAAYQLSERTAARVVGSGVLYFPAGGTLNVYELKKISENV